MKKFHSIRLLHGGASGQSTYIKTTHSSVIHRSAKLDRLEGVSIDLVTSSWSDSGIRPIHLLGNPSLVTDANCAAFAKVCRSVLREKEAFGCRCAGVDVGGGLQ